jgi:hypothetical protein
MSDIKRCNHFLFNYYDLRNLTCWTTLVSVLILTEYNFILSFSIDWQESSGLYVFMDCSRWTLITAFCPEDWCLFLPCEKTSVAVKAVVQNYCVESPQGATLWFMDRGFSRQCTEQCTVSIWGFSCVPYLVVSTWSLINFPGMGIPYVTVTAHIDHCGRDVGAGQPSLGSKADYHIP